MSSLERRVLRSWQSPDSFPRVVGVLLVAKLLLVRYLLFGRGFGYGVIADLLAILALVALCAAAGSIGRRAMSVIAVLTSFAALGMVVYASYYQQVPSLRILSSLQQVGELHQSVFDLLSWSHLLLLVDLPLVVLWAFRSRPISPRWRSRYTLVGTNALVAFFAFALAANAGSSSDSIRASYKSGLVAYQVSALVSAGRSGAAASLGSSELQRRINELTRHEDGPRRAGVPAEGSMKGMNLIVIQAEALQAGLVGARVAGQPIVPNLEKLIDESMYFPNTYSQTGRGNTADAEFMANTSLYPSTEQAASVTYGKKQLPGLPRLLSDEGYQTMTFHTNDVRFWNRNQMYPALGFDRYYDKEYFGADDVTGYGSSDGELFYKTWMVLLEAEQQSKPYYAQIVTVSAHHPFTAVADRGTLDLPPAVERTTTGRYLQSQSYFDAQLGQFLMLLESSGILDNSVVVLYGDHFGLRFENATPQEAAIRKKLYGRGYNKADFFNIPLVIRVPGGQPLRDETVLGQVDILPTIADLYGLDISGMPHFGRSAFVDTPTLMTRGGDASVYIDETRLFLTGLEQNKDKEYSSTDQHKLRAVGPRPQHVSNTSELLELSESYARSLPERPSANEELGIIPKIKAFPQR